LEVEDRKCKVSVVAKMAAVPVPGCQTFWTNKHASHKSEYQPLIGEHPDADAQLQQLFKILCDIEDVAGYTPSERESAE
jgi:hypothetical protein